MIARFVRLGAIATLLMTNNYNVANAAPTKSPVRAPTKKPITNVIPTKAPVGIPSKKPSLRPSATPTSSPTSSVTHYITLNITKALIYANDAFKTVVLVNGQSPGYKYFIFNA